MSKSPFIVPYGPTSRRVTSTKMGLTPDTASAEAVCPDGFKVTSWAKQTRLNNLTQGRHFLPAINNWVSTPKII